MPRKTTQDAISFSMAAAAFALSACLLILAFMPRLYGLTVWIALVPALLVAQRLPLRRLLRLSWVFGYLCCLALYYWVIIVTVPGWLLLPLYLGLYWPAFFVTNELLARRFGIARALGALALWPILEYLRGSLLTGLPWYYLAHSLYRWPRLIQSADLGGAIFLSTIIVAVNVLLADALQNRRDAKRALLLVLTAVLVFVANLAYGAWRIESLDLKRGPVVACVQPNIPQSLKLDPSPRDSVDLFMKLRSYTLDPRAADAAVVFWPETIMPGLLGVDDFTVANGMTPAELIRELSLQNAVDADTAARLNNRVDAGVDFLDALTSICGPDIMSRFTTERLLSATAALAAKPLVAGAIAADVDPAGFVIRTYNRACWLDRDGSEVAFYDKVHLVPFGEFIPFRDSAPGLSRMLAAVMPVEPVTYPGDDFKLFDVAGVKFAPAICFEDTFSYIARDCRLRGADVLLNLTNDGWFGRSDELEAHLANSLFRAVETRMAVVRCANTGISAVISPVGVVSARLTDDTGRDRAVKGLLVAPVDICASRTLYLSTADFWMLLLPTFLLVSIIARRRHSD